MRYGVIAGESVGLGVDSLRLCFVQLKHVCTCLGCWVALYIFIGVLGGGLFLGLLLELISAKAVPSTFHHTAVHVCSSCVTSFLIVSLQVSIPYDIYLLVLLLSVVIFTWRIQVVVGSPQFETKK